MPHSEEWKAKWKQPVIEHMVPTKWGWSVWHPENLTLGKYVDIGCGTVINAAYGVMLSDEVEVGPLCAIMSESSIDGKAGHILLADRCKLGSHCSVMPGVVIGENAIIGSHSFVNQSIAPNVLAFGVPAEVIRQL